MSVSELNSSYPLYENLISVCTDNRQYFEKQSDEKSQKLYAELIALEEQIENITPLLNEFRLSASEYDFKNIAANGYRSFLTVTDKLSKISLKICTNIRKHRDSLFFSKLHYIKEIGSCGLAYSSLNYCLQLLQLLKTSTNSGQLFLYKTEKLTDIQKCMDKVDTKSFFGRIIGFQFGESSQHVIKTIAIMMTAFAEYYYNNKNILHCATLCSQLFANPGLRAEKIAYLTNYRTCSLNFCQDFWNISEKDIFKKMNKLFQPTSFINKIIEIPPNPICYSLTGSNITIPIPEAHIGLKSLYVRLISSVKRQGMITDNNESVLPPANWFIFHLHGGGFISQTSESHQIYLKNWSKWTEAPILSVDYSLAPEAPYPRALEEVLFAYVWALNNLEMLGTTAERIVFAGDSAGANLCLSLTLKCIELNLRKPDGLFLAYVPSVLQFYPSPSRFLGLLDPILSFGFMMCCIKAYTQRCKSSSLPMEADNYNDKNAANASSFANCFNEIATDALENDECRSEMVSTPMSHETNSSTSKTRVDDEHNYEDVFLPAKYKNIVSSFIINLKEKFHSRSLKNFRKGNRNVTDADLSDILNIEELILGTRNDIFLSPVEADDEYFKNFPSTAILTVEMDPCLDDCILLAKKIDSVRGKVHLDVLQDLAHGFLNVSLSTKEAYNGSKLCAQRIKELFTNTLPSQ